MVEQPVAKGWQVDSDPLPSSIEEIKASDKASRHELKGAIAIFRVHANPGEIVRLHVGERHAAPLKTRMIAAPLMAAQAKN